MLLRKRNRRILLGSQVVSSSAITFFTYSNISPTLVNINMLSFPNICITSPLKAYFDYVAKPFVTINKISIVGPCCFPNCRYLNLITLVEFWLNKVRIRRLNLRKVTLGDVSVLWAVLTFVKTRQESRAKQAMSPKGQHSQREQFDEAVSCVTNTK